jgi:hypothetical protein
MGSGEIKSRLMPVQLGKDKKLINLMLASESTEDALRAVYPDSARESGSYYNIELYCKRGMKSFYQRLLRMSTCPSTVFVAFSELNLLEVENLISIIEGIRYSVAEADIAKRLAV